MSGERERSFTQQAAAFEDPRFNRLFTTDSEWLFERLPLDSDDLVLDVAAGTGHVSRRLAPQVRAVVALDATRAMLEQGRAQAPPNVIFVQGDAERLPFLDGSFDVVVTRFAVHHFEDPLVPLAEMHRVSRGRVAVADLIAHPEAAETQNRLETLRDPSHTRMLELDELAKLVGTDDVEVRDVHRPLEPWLVQTDPAPDAAEEIRAALRDELAGGAPTGFRPSERDGELHFVHTMASLIAPGTP
ncbi:MAG TPA: class I SAM-dependent methyltransferase [Solirubrobacteraceae bacterium]|nr:class I SAM-dependent methyltransferase [Solirubrobacteraceae bacterium]